MVRFALVAVTLGAVLAAMGIALRFTGDGHVLVSPPEAVGEGFFREVETKRFSRALPYLNDDLRNSVSEEDLRQLLNSLERRHGTVEDVRGEKSRMEGDRAEADVTIKTASEEMLLHLGMRREKHLWKISELPAVP